jgi:hypothetical protein
MPGQEPEAPQRPSRSPTFTPGARYSVFVGLVFIGLIVVAAINGARTNEGTVLGTEDVRGEPIPEFAVPDIRGTLEGDANVFQDDCGTSENPCPADERRTPACEIEPEGAIRVCDLFDRPLAISFWFTRGADCLPTQDVLERVAARYRGRVNFLSLNVGDDRENVREIVRDRGWRIPVGYDADGTVSNLYRVGGCPTVAFLYPGGILRGAGVGTDELTEERLDEQLRALVRESRRRAARDR